MFRFWKKRTPQVPVVKRPPSDEEKKGNLQSIIIEALPFKVGYCLDENHQGALYIFSVVYPQKKRYLSFRPFYNNVIVFDQSSPINTDILLDENNIQVTINPDYYEVLGMLMTHKRFLTDYLTKVATGEIKI